VVDDVAGDAVERGERGDPRKVSDHIGVGPHRVYGCEVAPLRVDDYMTLVRGGDEGGRDPAVEPADDTFSIVAQEFDELCWFSGSKVKTLIRVVTSFVTAIVVFMMFRPQKRCSVSLHHEDDSVHQNGSIGKKRCARRVTLNARRALTTAVPTGTVNPERKAERYRSLSWTVGLF